jgi:hypothetical protein
MQLRFGEGRVASFPGPNADGKADFDLALTRPIMFDTMTCVGSTGGHCVLSWVGAQP